MAKFNVNPSKDVLTAQMRESMNRILEGRNMEKDMTNRSIAEDMTNKPYVPVPEDIRGESSRLLLEPADAGEVGTTIGGAPNTRAMMDADLRQQIDSKFNEGSGSVPASAMPYQEPATSRPVQPRGTRAGTGSALNDWVANNTINWEARRDRQGNLAVYDIPSGDYGGTREVAGITDKYHPEAFKRISALPPAQREKASADYVLDYTAPIANLVPEPLKAQAVDLGFNRGPGGYTTLIQRGLNSLGVPVRVDGAFGKKTLAAMGQVDPVELINATEDAYLQRERAMAEADPNRAKLYQGIVNRSNKRRQSATMYAKANLPYTGPLEPEVKPPPKENVDESSPRYAMANLPYIGPLEPEVKPPRKEEEIEDYSPRPLGLGLS
jgi:lysozyme family protein